MQPHFRGRGKTLALMIHADPRCVHRECSPYSPYSPTGKNTLYKELNAEEIGRAKAKVLT